MQLMPKAALAIEGMIVPSLPSFSGTGGARRVPAARLPAEATSSRRQSPSGRAVAKGRTPKSASRPALIVVIKTFSRR